MSDRVRTVKERIAGRVLDVLGLHYGVYPKLLLEPGNEQPRARYRQVYMYILKEKFLFSYPEAARFANRKDHTTALHAHRKIRYDAKAQEDIVEIMVKIAESERIENDNKDLI